MEALPKDTILKFNQDTLKQVRKNYGFENSSDINKAIDSLQEWVKKQHHFTFKEFERSYLERVIIRCKGSVERAKERMDKACTMRTLMPQFFSDFDMMKDFADLDTIVSQFFLSKMDSENNRVYMLRNLGQKFKSNFILQYSQQALLMFDYVSRFDYANSYIVILDYRTTNLYELATSMNLVELRQTVSFITEAFGVRIKSLHIVSPSKFVDMVVPIFKQIFSAKIGGRIYVHKSLDTVYDHVERNILPIEYGGKDSSVDKYCDDWRSELSQKKHRDQYKLMTNAKTDESRRLTAKFNEQYMGTPGSFRTLNVD